jgi:leucyl-tRNA synthetase
MEKYSHKDIEEKWQKKWTEDGLYTTQENDKPKYYVLDMFPYPSGEGLHVGHPKGYIATDILSRFKTMNGFNVLHPMGWDAFGLPAEQFAIKHKIHPKVAVDKNVARFKDQLTHIGFTYDWNREINTTDPEYYKWTQWIFLKLFEKGLAYESYEPINWCPSCQTGLANEDLESDGTCERCGSEIEKKPMRQWVLRITDYADRMLDDLALLPEWPESVKEMQRNWIGKSEGAEIDFALSTGDTITVFTTRPDTLFGATYLVLAPEHALLQNEDVRSKILNVREVEHYIAETAKKDEITRTKTEKEKTGVRLDGITATNPANGEAIPVFIADYVLAHYGTGAIMAVPAHDERDFAFAKKYNLPITLVIAPDSITIEPITMTGVIDEPYIKNGNLMNSGEFDGMPSEDAKAAITKKVGGRLTNTYRLQDWVFSRQRYWGEPIPLIHCATCGVVPVPESALPVRLPDVENYEPSGTGESPLATIDEWVNTSCPKCGGDAKRETNTMPQWAGSSWYYLRYMDAHNKDVLVDPAKERYWGQVDTYVGGMEHATRHLIYARFWHKFLYDIGVVTTKEPFVRLYTVGLIQAEDGRKMSKRWGNVINPDDVIAQVGADTLRVYEMFMGPFENAIAWSTDSMVGSRRFIERVWRLQDKIGTEPMSDATLHKTIKKVTDDIQNFAFNTAISQMMICVNEAEESGLTREQYQTLITLLAPFVPHVSEELWHVLGNTTSIHQEAWPVYDESKMQKDTAIIAVQINGKMRGTVEVATNAQEADVMDAVRADMSLKERITGEPKRIIYVPKKIINIIL